MRNFYIALAVIIIILLGFFWFRSRGSHTTSNHTANMVLSMIKQNVYKIDGAKVKEEVIEPTKVYEGEEVETSDTGRALLQMENGTLSAIDYSTKLTVKTHIDDEHAGISLLAGNVWSTVEKVFGKGEYYEIETQNAVAVVRGTSFGVSIEGDNTVLEVSEGAVLFVPIDPKTGKRLYDKAVLVPAGKKAILGSAGVIEVFDMTKDDLQDEWYIYNNGLSETTASTGASDDLHISDVEIVQ